MKECRTCGSYCAYYTKNCGRFMRQKQGFCEERECIVQNHGSCEQWQNDLRRRAVSKKFCLKTLHSAMTHLAQISQILAEEQQEQRENEKRSF